MIEMRWVSAPAFRVCGKSVYITGQDNAQFDRFWRECHENGLIERLNAIYAACGAPVTHSRAIGVSRVEKDPMNRAFDFFIAAECASEYADADLAVFTVPACDWAVFRNEGRLPDCLVESEIYAMTKWLPASGESHAMMPEMEVYPNEPCENGTVTEFWLPLRKR